MRNAELISPPNKLKEAVGHGGLDQMTLKKAQSAMEGTVTDFRPMAVNLVNTLTKACHDARQGTISGEVAIEAMIHPAMQLKAQGGMFKYNLITDVCNILVNFLETVDRIDADVIDIVEGHLKTINAILGRSMSGDGGPAGKALRDALMDACNRFYRSRSSS